MKILDHGFVELVSRPDSAGLATVNAARLSYGKQVEEFEDRDAKLIAYLLQHGHTSPFRHAMFSFHIKAPLFVFRQWWKYQVGCAWREYEATTDEPLGIRRPTEASRMARAVDIQISTDPGCSWNELSGRYKVLEPEFYVPTLFRYNTGKQAANLPMTPCFNETWQQVMREHNADAMSRYQLMLDAGIARELARLVLPPTIYSEAVWTVSLQAVLHFLDQRLKPDAQFEIREYARGVLDLIRPDLDAMGVNPCS